MSQARARAPLTPEFDRALREAAAISWFEPPEEEHRIRRAPGATDGERHLAVAPDLDPDPPALADPADDPDVDQAPDPAALADDGAAQLENAAPGTRAGAAPAPGGAGRGAAGGARRTVVIRGQTAPPRSSGARRRPPRTARERVGARPDRLALWAVLLGFVLVLIAASSSHAAVAPDTAPSGGQAAPLTAPPR